MWHRICKTFQNKKSQTTMKENKEEIKEQEEVSTEQTDNQTESTDKEQTTEQEANADAENSNETAEEEAQQKDPLKAAQEEIAKLKDQYLRKAAEFENFRKRTIKEKADLILNGGEKTIVALLPVIDDMERAIENGAKTEDPAVIREGIELIYQKCVKTLESLGVKKIDTNDADFNTDMHEAIALVPGMGDDKKGKVIDCVQTGYTLNEKVIRHAKVAVGQ